MEEKQESLYEVRIDFGQSEKETERVTLALLDNAKATKALQETQKGLEKEIASLDAELQQNGKLTSDQNKRLQQARKEYADTSKQIVVNKEEQRSLRSEQKSLIASTQSQSESIKQLRAQLALNTLAYNAMGKEQRQNSEEGMRLRNETKAISDELKRLEGGVGDTRRNVGNYTASIKEALVGTGKFGKGLSAITAISSGGVFGIIVAALSGLVQILSKAQPVIDRVTVLMSGLSSVFDVVVQRAGLLFSAFGKLFTGDFTGAINDTKSAFDGLGTAISQANAFGQAYAETIKLIEDSGQQLEVQEARNSAQIAQLNAQLRDRSRTEKERVAIAQQIQKLEEDTFKQRDQLLRQELNLQQSALRRLLLDKGVAEAAAANAEQLIKLAQDAQIEDAKWIKVKEQLVKVYQNEEQSLALIERTQTRLNQVNEQTRAEQEKNAAARLKQIEDEKKAREASVKFQEEAFKMLLDAELKAIETASKEQDIARKSQLAFDLQAAQSAEERAALQAQYEADITSQKAINLQAQIEALQTYSGEVLGIDQMVADKQLELSTLVTDAKITDINTQIKAQEDAAKKAETDSQKQADAQKQIFANLANDLGADIAAAVDAIFEGQEAATEKFLASILTTTLDVIEKTLIAEQAAAIAATTLREISTKGLAGLLTAAANIAIIKGAFAVAKNVIKSTIPKFEDGGLINGNRHSNGGVLLEAEGGEFIVNRKATAQFRPMLERINQTGVQKFESGGYVAMPTPSPIFATQDNAMNMAFFEAFASRPIYTDITEIRAVSNKVNVTQRRRTL